MLPAHPFRCSMAPQGTSCQAPGPTLHCSPLLETSSYSAKQRRACRKMRATARGPRWSECIGKQETLTVFLFVIFIRYLYVQQGPSSRLLSLPPSTLLRLMHFSFVTRYLWHKCLQNHSIWRASQGQGGHEPSLLRACKLVGREPKQAQQAGVKDELQSPLAVHA